MKYSLFLLFFLVYFGYLECQSDTGTHLPIVMTDDRIYTYQPLGNYTAQGGNPQIYNPPDVAIPPVYYIAYHYTDEDTGGFTNLGIFLRESLTEMKTPNFWYYGSGVNALKPKYDHYTVYHYYKDKKSIHPESRIEANSVVTCVGDSSSICPFDTYALCNSSGSIMCVADVSRTHRCNAKSQVMCVSVEIPCIESYIDVYGYIGSECVSQNQFNSNVTAELSCVYNTKLVGNVSYVNNTIVVQQSQSNVSNATRAKEYNFCVLIVAVPALRPLTEDEILLKNTGSFFAKFLEKSLIKH